MTLNRTIAPFIKEPDQFRLPQPRHVVFPNGTELYILNMGEQDVCRIDLMWEIGSYDEPVHLSSDMANKMLKEGAGGLPAAVIAEKLDYYGAWLQTSVSSHFSYITLYSLNKYFDNVLPLLETIVKCPDFPEQDFDTLRQRRKQQLRISLEKVQTLSNNAFRKQIFGDEHPYAYAPSVADYDNLTVNHLRKLHKQYYRPERCRMIISGKISQNILKKIEEKFGRYTITTTENPMKSPVYPLSPSGKFEYVEDKPGALQSSVRVGQPVISRSHPDFLKLRIANTALGGYFGSRLMTNIREDKGYTYGISSAIAGLRHASYFTVGSQTGTEYTRHLIREVIFEIERLQNDLLEKNELMMVRNYMSGELARGCDSPFSIADMYAGLLANSLPFDYYSRQSETIREITAEEIRRVAREYLDISGMYVTIAGDKEKIEF